jgi:hypothetical protein
MKTGEILASSFRDPAGFVFTGLDGVYRQVNHHGRQDYDLLMQSGLYDRLVEKAYLIPHQEIALDSPAPGLCYKILRPEQVPFISYPYEWSFSQLQDAAALTLRIQKHALKDGLSLKDCSAFNVQFLRGKPVFIDTLSFEKYEPGAPWAAYRQFCQQFLAPLALMHYTGAHLSGLLRLHLDGIPLPLASRLLPARARLNLGCLLHLILHARSIEHYTLTAAQAKLRDRSFSRESLLGLVDDLGRLTTRLRWKPAQTSWGDYDPLESYSDAARDDKSRLVEQFLLLASPATVWDLGANQGVFSRIAAHLDARQGVRVIAFDSDPLAVERHYLQCRNSGETNLLPLVVDLTNPTPALGWQSQERLSFLERGPVDLVLALALEHHLAIGSNIPFPSLAEFFSKTCRWLVIEFVPKSDPQVQRMLQFRKDIFSGYSQENFEQAFSTRFEIVRSEQVQDSQRILYLMENKQPPAQA